MKYSGIKKLYKYKRIDSQLLNSLSAGCVFAPIIEQLNDPFESSVYIGENEIEKGFYNSIYKEIEKNIEIKIENKKKEHINNMLYNNEIDLNSIIKDIDTRNLLVKNFAKSLGVVSFSSENDILLLWSHYADSHKGLCLEFSRQKDCLLGNDEICFPVQYSSFIKDIEKNLGNNISRYEFFRYKSDIWDYEKEWRLIVQNGKTNIKFPGSLKHVYFGLETKDDDIVTVRRILGDDIKYSKAEKVVNQYKIGFKRLT